MRFGSVIVALALSAACGSGAAERRPATRPGPHAGTLRICGEDVPCGVAVVAPDDPRGFDGAAETCRLTPGRAEPKAPAPGCEGVRRYGERPGAPGGRWTLGTLRERIDQVVLHYDAAVTSSRCFEVLHDERGLSCHFLLDVDGTLFQTLDLSLRARHATVSNDRSIGVEIAHVGAFDRESAFKGLYAYAPEGLVLAIPARLRPPPPGTFRPARPHWIRGTIHGRALMQPDFTAAQYETLRALLASLRATFPRIAADAPRDASGRVLETALPPEQLAAFRGVLGHFHVTRDKIDPGPAFDWERVVR
ncbi:MAG: hypothetical protein HMLKMBBP_02853 [Planctomycetes bacterium]|nr:hypothetical protein [Planctomycetota bacterium]